MKLLVITQTIDVHNTTLGFFTGWVEEFSKRFDSVEVICLSRGQYVLPSNVTVYSLGKEKGNSRLQYIKNFFTYIWRLRGSYDAVFVHMNQEYVVLGGLFWKLLGKKIFFWRNHPYGNIWTRIAILFSHQVFCTADKSFTAHYKKTKLMPAGVDTRIFRPDDSTVREKGSLLIFGRVAPVKQIEKAIDATAGLLAKGFSTEISIVGDWLDRDITYVESLKKRVAEARIEPSVHFVRGVDFVHAPMTFQSHEISLNFTDSGSFDKTVIEALACGTKVLVSNTSMKSLLPAVSYTTGEVDDVLEKLNTLLSFSLEENVQYAAQTREVVENQSLSKLMDMLYTYIHGKETI